MKRKASLTLRLTDKDDKELFFGSAYDIKLEESLIKSLSVEFFNDPEPCFIHQSAVICRAAGEIEQELNSRGRLKVSCLPPDISRYFSVYEGCCSCELCGK